MRRNKDPNSDATIHINNDNEEEETNRNYNNNNNKINEDEEDDKNEKIEASFSAFLYTLLSFVVCTTAAAVSYYSTLEGGETEQWLHAKLYGMALWMVVSDVLFTASIMLSLSLSGRWRKGTLGYAIAVMLLMFSLDQGNTVQHHGAYNSLAFIVFLTPMLVLALLWRTCYFRLSCKSLFLLNIGIVLSIVFLFIARATYVKNDWNKGLLGLKFENGEQYHCVIHPPSVNAMAILPYRAWNFWAGSHKCAEMTMKGTLNSDGLLTIENCKHNPQYALLPEVSNWPVEDKLYNTFQNNTFSLTRTFNYTEPVYVDAEAVIVECGGSVRNVLVRSIEKEETKKRVKEFKEKNPPKEKRYNVVFLNFDAVARSHFHRRFPKTKDFITKMHKSGSVEFFEFFRYHVLEVYTFPNLIAMYSGVPFNIPSQGEFTTVWDEFYNNGYVSASVDNSCLDWSGKYQKVRVSKVDHQFVAPFCLPEVHPLHNPYGNFAGPFSILRRCLAGDYVHKYSFNYLSQFVRQYPEDPKFIVGAFNEGHEGTGEVIGLVDEDLVEFMEEIDYDNSIVFIVSDHGLHMNIMFAFREQSVIKENALGLLTAIFPKGFLEDHPDIHANLQHNRQALVTPYEIFETLRTLAVFPEKPTSPRTPNSLSLFDEVPYSRTCAEAKIPPHFCICNREQL